MHFMCVFEESYGVCFHAWCWCCGSKTSGGRDSTEDWRSGQIKSCSTHRCAVKTLEAPGTEQGPASQAGWVTAYPRDRDHHKLHIKSVCVCVGRLDGLLKKNKKHHINIMNYVLLHSFYILPEVAVVNRCTSQILIITTSVGVCRLCKSDLLHRHAVGWLLSSPVSSD